MYKFTEIKNVIKNNHQLIEYFCGILELDYQLYAIGYLFDHEYVSAKRTSDKISKDTKVVGEMVGRGTPFSSI